MQLATSFCCTAALIAATCATAANPPDARPAALPSFAPSVEDIVQPGWKQVTLKSGDLDGDAKPDVAVLMRSTARDRIKPLPPGSNYPLDDTNPYVLAIGLARPNGYDLVYSKRDLFPNETAPSHGDDAPDDGSVDIRRGVLTLNFGHLRGYDRLRFRWDGKAFRLIGLDCAGVTGGEITTLSANYLTRKARYTHAAISDDREKASMITIAPAKRPSLDQFDWIEEWSGHDSRGNTLSC
ncbi:hypothetical protein NSE01_17400 [Novosphingobium sediminis]|uniref:Lipoprotein n=1 Tax=Novosphingobium sediminis TaxID=707214 RepID=A0A512AJM4_9SPHN|nr:hypothetical protein [Novosphingobium sediminis]GEN99907.1 hypothetical protein NSE01_17400 [Novosphingobium sediminis]